MATKKQTLDDFTKNPQAQTVDDVNGQDARTRLWQSLNYAYGDQQRKSDEQYALARSQADRQALSRGMQRSSYNNATLANLENKRIEARNDIASAQIADYQNRIGQLEQQEKEDERWERQFAEQQRQHDESMAFNREQFEEQKQNTAWNQGFQQSQANQSQANWQAQFENTQQQQAQAQENWQTQFGYQQQQDQQAQQNWQTQFDNTVQQQQQAQANWQSQFDNTVQQQQQAQANWQAQFDANQQQQAWQNQFQQNQWNWQVSQATAAQQQAASSGRPSYSNNPGNNNDKPWEALGLTQEEYEKLKNGGNNVNLFGNPANTGGTVWSITGGAGGGKPNTNMTK